MSRHKKKIPRRIRRVAASELPSEVFEKIARDAQLQIAIRNLVPSDPIRALRALALIAAIHGLHGEVDEESLTIKLRDLDEDERETY